MGTFYNNKETTYEKMTIFYGMKCFDMRLRTDQ